MPSICSTRTPVLVLSTALALLGCAAVGPNYERPALAIPAGWHAALPHGGEPQALLNWWMQFNDPLLGELVADAEAASPTLATAAARISEARAALTGSEANALPAVDGSGSLVRSATRGDIPVAARNTGVVAVDAGWEIDLFGRVRRSTEAAEALLAARQYDWHEARVSLAAEVADTYVGYRACRQLEAAYDRDVISGQETERLTRLAVDAGFTAPADGELARASLAETRSERESQRATCELTIKSLVALVGLPESALRGRLDPERPPSPASLPVPAAFTVTSVPLKLLSQRPDVAAAEQELAAATAEVGVAEANRYPRVSLLGSISTVSISGGGGSTNSQPWAIGPALYLPLFDAGSRAADVKAAEARVLQQRSAYESSVREAIKEVEQALVRLDSARLREADAATAATGFANYFTATDANWRAGGVSLLALEIARRNANNAERRLIALQRDRVQDWIFLYKALGGGWQADAGDPS